MSKVYYKGYSVPYPLGTPEWESFKNYVKAYYKECMQIAADASGGGLTPNEKIHMAILQATLSPLVYLWEKWQLMSIDEKLKYSTPEYKVELKRVKDEAQKVKEKAGTA